MSARLLLLVVIAMTAVPFTAGVAAGAVAGAVGAMDEADLDVRRAQAQHDKAVKSAEADVTSKTKEVARLTKELSDFDARALKLDKDLERAKAMLDEVENAPKHLSEAQATMDAAEAKMNKEFSANHNPNGNNNGVGNDAPGTGRGGGGASAETSKAYEDAQKEFQRMKRVAADAASQLTSSRQRVTAVEKNRKNLDAKKAEAAKRLELAQGELDGVKAKLEEAKNAPLAADPATPAR